MNLEEQKRRYRDDAKFHMLVTHLRTLLEAGQVSIQEGQDALNLAAFMVASESILPRAYITREEARCFEDIRKTNDR